MLGVVNGLSGAVESRSAFGMLEFVLMSASSVVPGSPGRGSLSGNSDDCSQASDGGEASGSRGDGC